MPLPLLRLPEKLTVDVLRTFRIRELLAISLLSKRAKNAVKLLKIQPLHLNLCIKDQIVIDVTFNDPTQNVILIFYKWTQIPQTVVNIPETVTVTLDGIRMVEWKFPASKMTMKDWYMHVINIFNVRLSVAFYYGFTIFDFESIKNTLKCMELQKLYISGIIPKNQSRMILKEFLPCSNVLILRQNPFLKQEDFRAILIQNLELINYGTGQGLTDFRLNDMLMCNFAFLYLTLPTWTDKEINRFLKLWRKGACPKLCLLVFYYNPEGWRWNQEEVLKGISFQEFTGDREIKWFNGRYVDITGGYDIRGMNGRICTIEVKEFGYVRFCFYD